jgi:transcriptional regulator with XRE-family HTH domain
MGETTVIGEFLRLVRREHGLTQEQFVEQLSATVKEFKALNTVTLSRWETGTTSPSYKKKRELLKFCANQGWQSGGSCSDFVRNRFEQLSKPLSGIFQHNYKTLIANVPTLRVPLEEYNLVDLGQAENLDYFEHIVDIETASNPDGYYRVTPEQLRRLCHHPASFSVLCERRKQHMGHFAMFKLTNEAAQRLVHRKLDENMVAEEHLCPPEVRGSYYIHALYGINPTMAALVNARAYLFLFDNKELIDNIAIFSSRPDGMRLARSYGIKTVARGKHKECGFVWYGMLSPVEDILFSDTVLKLIF